MHRIFFGLLIWLFTLPVFLVQAADSPDGHLVTQSMALRFNSAASNGINNRPLHLRQYFVPAAWVNVQADASVSASWQEYVQDPNQPGMIRILVHPFDHHTPIQLEKTLRKYNLPNKPSLFAIPLHITESRSHYPVQLIPNQIPVSPRLSMTHGLGKWHGREYKKHPYTNEKLIGNTKLISSAQAEFALVASRLVQERLNGTKGQFFEIQPERMIVTVQSPDGGLDLGETFRDISSSVRDGEYQVPGFVGQSSRGGLLLALANGKSSTLEYLSELEGPIRGRALAEFFARTGFVHSSPHSQNFLLTANQQFQLLGTLKIRDLPDLIPAFDSRQSDPAMAKLFENFQDARLALQMNLDGGKKYFHFRHGFVMGNENTENLDDKQLKQIEKAASKAFVTTLAEISGVSSLEIESITTRYFSNIVTNYAQTTFDRNTDVWRRVMQGVQEYRKKPRALKSIRLPLSKSNAKLGKWQNLIQAMVRDKLKGRDPSPEVAVTLERIWTDLTSRQPDSPNLEYIESALVALDIIPKGQAAKLYLRLKNADQKNIFFENLEKDPSTDRLIEFLESMTAFFRETAQFDSRIQEEIKAYVTKLAYKFASNEPTKLTPKLFEVLFFADPTMWDPRFIGVNTGKYEDWSKKIGTPPKVAKFLKEWIKTRKVKKGSFELISAKKIISLSKDDSKDLSKDFCSMLFIK